MVHQFELIGLRPYLHRRPWSAGPRLHATSRRRRALRRRRLHTAVLAPARPGLREMRHA